MTRPLIVANWKMNMTLEESRGWCAFWPKDWGVEKKTAEVVVCPSFVQLLFVQGRLLEIGFNLGAQDCAAAARGAQTGDVSAWMLKDAGCRYVIVGHSERRANHQEDDNTVCQKALQALSSGMIPIVCIGETLDERALGKTNEVLTRQLTQSLPRDVEEKPLVLAYEPVWAIGTGKVPTVAEITSAHAHIAAALISLGWKSSTPILYGGSVTPDNASQILALPLVGGLLVGGASLVPEKFDQIIKAA
ncbi:MAG: triose-phosphate isomerase [Alphaproteobacteria bacterium]|nr:triose-phosphate isomerase [Alphaproteobacteria bacterium]